MVLMVAADGVARSAIVIVIAKEDEKGRKKPALPNPKPCTSLSSLDDG
jgi:hypothetical protein